MDTGEPERFCGTTAARKSQVEQLLAMTHSPQSCERRVSTKLRAVPSRLLCMSYGIEDAFRVSGGDAQQSQCRSARLAAALLPALDSPFTHAYECGKLRAGQLELFTDRAWIREVRSV